MVISFLSISYLRYILIANFSFILLLNSESNHTSDNDKQPSVKSTIHILPREKSHCRSERSKNKKFKRREASSDSSLEHSKNNGNFFLNR